MNDPTIISVNSTAITFTAFLFINTPRYHYNKKYGKSKTFKHIFDL